MARFEFIQCVGGDAARQIQWQALSFGTLLEESLALETFDKRILALILSKALLQLGGGPWIGEKWSKESIFFFGQVDSPLAINIHKPYIATEFQRSTFTEKLDDDWDRPHAHPSILALGILLLEIELNARIESMRNPEDLIDGTYPNPTTDLITAWRMLKSPKCAKSVHDGYKTAIRACLECNFIPPGTTYSDPEFWDAVYLNVVVPIETELYVGWPDLAEPALDKLDTTLTIHHSVTQRASDSWEILEQGSAATPLMSSPRSDQVPFNRTLRHEWAAHCHPSDQRIVLFDEENTADRNKARLSDQWFDRMDKFLDAKICPLHDEPRPRRSAGPKAVKVAILDTGIDFQDTTINANKERIKETCDWIGDGIKDVFGHGTLAVALLLRTAPSADVYVARIAKDKRLADENYIVEAIDWALKCDVDIITMSFGMPNRSPRIDKAISRAQYHNKIMFAAAANDGANSTIAYPAKSDMVIGIHSLDGNGNRSGFTPSPLENRDNFATLGEAVESSWPDRSGTRVASRKSGTSYATPIAAGIAATFLDYATLKVGLDDDAMDRLYSLQGMRAIFKLMADGKGSKARDGYDYVAPWRLWEEGRSDESVHYAIIDALRTRP